MEVDLSFAQLAQLLHQHAGSGIGFFRPVLPLIVLAIVAEMLARLAAGRGYPWRNSLTSALVAAGHAIAQALTHGLVIGVFAAAAYHWRLFTIPISMQNWWWIVVLFVLADLAFYCEHRCSHRIRFLWAAHSVHHSIDRLVFTAAFRLAWTPIVSGVFFFYLPVVWLGFPPAWVFGMSTASLVYQIFVHTELVPRIGLLEWVVNTPSAHRVHHASNSEYIDRNFGGVLLVWDHLFGTYQAERADIVTVYGLTHPRSRPGNPFFIAYEEYWDLMRDVVRSGRWQYLVRPPGWLPAETVTDVS